MSGLPEGWQIVALGDVSDVIRGITFPASEKQLTKNESNVCCLRTANIQKEIVWSDVYFVPKEHVKRENQLVQHGDILMSMANSYDLVGKVAIAKSIPHETAFGAFLGAIRPRHALIGQYLFHFLRTEFAQIALRESSSQTTNIANISVATLSKIPVPIPPLPEQKRIADKLDTLLARVDACREHLDRVPAILKRFRQSVLAAATSGELTRDWRDANHAIIDSRSLAQKLHAAHAAAGGHKAGSAAPPTEGAHDLTPDMFPTSWSLVTLRDLVQPDRPITYGILKPGPELDDGVPYVRVADFPGERLNLTSIRKTSPAMDEEFKRSRLAAGDLLLSIRGTVGRVVIIPPALEKANITQDSARLSIQTCVSATFVLWALRSELVQQRMRGAIKGVAVRGMNIGDVRALQIPLPSREEQNEIARRVESLFTLADQLETRYTTARANINRLTPSLLAKAFRGDLVPQDPNDEPAAALLARIAAARQTAPERLGAKVGRRRGGRHAHAD